MTRAAKYRRISQDREGRELGIQRQDEDLDALAARKDLTIVASYYDNDVGASTRSRRKTRPGYQQLLADARAGRFEVVLAYTSGRLTRRPAEHEDLIALAEQRGVRFEYVRSPSFDLSTAQGRLVARTLAAQDAAESEEMAERVARAARQRAEQGLNHGGRRCYGYHPSGLELEPAEAAEVVRMATDLLAGVPLGRITRSLNARGMVTVSGRQWTPGTLRDLLRRPRLAGLSAHRGEVVGRGQWPPILTEDQHHAIVALLDDPTRRTTTGNRAAYLLSGIATCGRCGGPITSAGIKSRSHTSVRYLYRCRACFGANRRRDWVDEYVGEVVIARLSRDDARDLLVDRQAVDLAPLRLEAEALRVRLGELTDSFTDGEITRAQLARGTERLQARLAEIEATFQDSNRAPVLGDLVAADDVRTVWEGLDLDRRRAVVQALMRVRLLPGGGGRRTFDPAGVEITWVA